MSVPNNKNVCAKTTNVRPQTKNICSKTTNSLRDQALTIADECLCAEVEASDGREVEGGASGAVLGVEVCP